MKVVGIISEYNPFHNGHHYHLEQAKARSGADAVVCMMSGHFVQRGQAAIADKWTRTRMALACGADLVLELPVLYALGSAEVFALGAVAGLDALGCIDELWFGSESGKTEELIHAAEALSWEPQKVSDALRKLLDSGMAFPLARAKAYSEFGRVKEELISNPNNILAIEYIKALNRLNSSIQPRTLKRHGTQYHSIEAVGHFASATAVRAMLERGEDIAPYLPSAAYEIWCNAIESGVAPVWGRQLEQLVLYRLRTMTIEKLAQISDMAEGLEHRIKAAAATSTNLAELIEDIKTKRYTTGRISRLIWLSVLGIQRKEDVADNLPSCYIPPQYLRVLGMNQTGMGVLAKAKATAALPVITKLADFDVASSPLLSMDIAATDLYALGYPHTELRKAGRDYTTSPVVV